MVCSDPLLVFSMKITTLLVRRARTFMVLRWTSAGYPYVTKESRLKSRSNRTGSSRSTAIMYGYDAVRLAT